MSIQTLKSIFVPFTDGLEDIISEDIGQEQSEGSESDSSDDDDTVTDNDTATTTQVYNYVC